LKNITKNYSGLVLSNSESVLLPQQLYVIVAAQVISSSFICDIFSNISATKRFRKIQVQQIFFSCPWLFFEVVLARMQIRFNKKQVESPSMLTCYHLI